MKFFTKQTSIFALLTALFCAVAVFAAAANYQLFGDAELVSSGFSSATAAQLRSNVSGTNYGGVDFTVPAELTVADLDILSSDYKFTAGSCAGGSPRFQINVTDGTNSGNIQVYLGAAPNYTNCAPNVWANTGNLVAPTNLVDTSQLPGGTFYDPYSAAQTRYAAYTITGIQLVADGSWALNATQTVLADNVKINSTTVTFESANSCKNDGYQLFTGTPGPFKNQGQCVSYFAKGGQ